MRSRLRARCCKCRTVRIILYNLTPTPRLSCDGTLKAALSLSNMESYCRMLDMTVDRAIPLFSVHVFKGKSYQLLYRNGGILQIQARRSKMV